MYKCESCLQQIAAGISSRLFPIQIRDKVYPRRPMPAGADKKVRDHYGKPGFGFETVRELRLCPDCFERVSATAPTDKTSDRNATAERNCRLGENPY